MARDDLRTILDTEVIYGALRREKLWQIGFFGMSMVSVIAIAAAAYVISAYRPPAPVVVPFDPTTGLAVPNAAVGAVSLDEESAVVQAMIYQYVQDRETYNRIDNDLRIKRALERSVGNARNGIIRLWDSGSADYLPARYGDKTSVDVIVVSITVIDEGRIQVRMRKRLRSPDGETLGNFTANIGYDFAPGEVRTLEAVWRNPLGFRVTEYSIFSDRGS